MKETAATSGDQRGFSLLELLVTLFVVVLITSLVTLNVTSGGYDIRLEAKVRNLADVASYALDEAQMLGRDYGLLLQQLDVDGEVVYSYSWRERLPEGWSFVEVAGVAVDSQDRVYVFNRGAHPMIVFDKEGQFQCLGRRYFRKPARAVYRPQRSLVVCR